MIYVHHQGFNAIGNVFFLVAGPATFGAHRSSAASLNEELRKNLAAESYLDYAAAAAAAMAAANVNASKAVGGSREKLEVSAGGQMPGVPPPPIPSKSQQSGGQGGDGPIRIRNLEDLIRQLDHRSRHLSSPGSDEIRDANFR